MVFRLAIPINPSRPEPNNHTAAGTGTSGTALLNLAKVFISPGRSAVLPDRQLVSHASQNPRKFSPPKAPQISMGGKGKLNSIAGTKYWSLPIEPAPTGTVSAKLRALFSCIIAVLFASAGKKSNVAGSRP